MNDRKIKQLNILVMLVLISGIIFAGIFIFAVRPAEQRKITADELRDFNDGWLLRGYRGGSDKFLDLPAKLDADKEETIIIVHEIPEDVTKNSVLVLETKFQNILVTIGDRTVYRNGVITDTTHVKNAVPCTNVIEIGSGEPGELISIYMVSAYERYSGSIGSIRYGTKGDVISGIIRSNGASFVIAAILIIITLILIVSVCCIRNVNVNKKRALYGFGFVLAAGIWSLTNNSIMQLITENMFAVYMINMIVLLVMPVLYVMHQRCFAVKRRYGRIFEIGIYIYAVNMLIGVVFQLLHVCDFASYIVVTKILIVAGLLLLAAIMYLAADTYGDRSILNNLAAHLVLTVATIAEAVLSIFDFYKNHDGIVLQTGVYLFMLLLVIAIEKSIIKEMKHTNELAHLSYEQEKTHTIKTINTKLIYNALNTAVNNLKGRDMENSRLIYDTSAYMKYNIMAVTEEKIVPFTQEMEYIKAYLGIQRKRYENLELVVEDKVTDFKVPFNTVEPLVENAVINGAMKANSGGRVVVRSYERLDCFAIQIVDNGKGVGPDKRFDGKQSFKDIRRRLKKCGAAVEIKNKPDKGTIVTVKIPKPGYIVKEN